MPTNLPYPSMFDPSQMSNPYSPFNGVAIPWSGPLPSSSGNYYIGQDGSAPPTDAMGKPIQSFVDANATAQAKYQQDLAAYNSQPKQTPGTTLNSTPQSQQIADLQEQINQQTINSANASYGSGPGYSGRGAETGIANSPGAVDAIIGDSNYRTQANQQYAANPDFGLGMPQQSQPSQSGQGAAPTPPNMTQAYLNALANPGKVTTPGVAVPPSLSQYPSGQSSVLQNFLANNQPSTGAGNYNNAGFFNALKGSA